MRALVVCALVALVAGVVGAGDLRAVAPVTCADPCQVVARSSNYGPPLVALTDGTTLQWVNGDSVAHINVETPVTSSTSCFSVVSTPGTPSEPVRFDMTSDGLVAVTSPGTPDEASAVCENAVGTPTTGYVLSYHCTLHPQMRGVLVVVPG